MFIQNCCIHTYRRDLIKKIQSLGYIWQCTLLPGRKYNLTCLNGELYDFSFDKSKYCSMNDPQYQSKIIDCGKNENIFLALAALRNDSDYKQWFTNNEYDIWLLYNNTEEISFDKVQDCYVLREDNNIILHKATIKEIIKHFESEKWEENDNCFIR